MMSLIPYYPSRSSESLMRSFFDDPFFSPVFGRMTDSFFADRTPAINRSVREMRGMMRVDVEDKGETYLLTADMPGVQKENVKVSVENGILTITADYSTERREAQPKAHSEAHSEEQSENGGEEKTERRYLYQERRTGSMSRSFSLEGIEEKDICAEYANGVLLVTLPKQIEQKAEGARQIEIR